MVLSKDGTKVPLNIVRKKGTRFNGENPTLLTGYGGYGVSPSRILMWAVASGSTRAASSPWPTPAAAASSGRTGITPAT
jgi:hypothetical protein